MSGHDLLKYLFRRQCEQLIAAYERIPEEKRDLKPCDMGRSARDQMRECATNVQEFGPDMRTGEYDFSRERMTKWFRKRANLVNDAEIIAGVRAAANAYDALVNEMADTPLDEDRPGVFGPDTKRADILAAPYWNLCYHEGQITQIGLMHGIDPYA